MPKFPGVNHLNAVRVLEKAGFWVALDRILIDRDIV
jgi:hypothetical protein